MNDAAWHAWRKGGVGASDLVAILFAIYGGLYAFVAGRLGHDVDLGDNADEKQRGHDWEERIADAVQALTGLWVVGEQTWSEHPDHPTHRATVDAFLAVVDDPTVEAATMADVVALLETKTVGQHAEHHWDRWTIQTQWQMHVTGVRRALIVAVTVLDTGEFGGLRVRWVDADPDLQHELAGVADDAWSWVERGELPDPDTATALPYVKALTARADTGADVVDLDDIGDQLARFAAIKQAEATVKAEREQIEALIKHRLGAATRGATSDGWRITYTAPSRVLDDLGAEAVLLAHPELARTVTTLDVDAARKLLGAGLDEFKSPIGARRLLPPQPPKGQK